MEKRKKRKRNKKKQSAKVRSFWSQDVPNVRMSLASGCPWRQDSRGELSRIRSVASGCPALSKNACDGIEGALKRSAAKASLQRPLDNQILNPLDFYNFCKTNIKNVKMFFVTADEVKTITAFLAPCLAAANTIQGTQKHRRFIPINENCLQIYQISSSNSEINSKIVKMMQDKSS